MTADLSPLRWTSRYAITPGSRLDKLQGDKIMLPPSALEQLLSASTKAVDTDDEPRSVPLGPFGSRAPPPFAREAALERQQTLPHPLTFRLVNPSNGNVAYAGVREFSAEEGQAGLSAFLWDLLGFKEADGDAGLVVHAQQLPKGQFVRLRPLESYENEDWKPLLERYLRNTFTTLISGEILVVPSGREEFRFLVDQLAPETEAICIVDTDLEVDIEPLNEDQARETLKRRLEKEQKAEPSKTGTSTGSKLEVGQDVQGQILPGDYVDYTLEKWDHTKALEIELEIDESDLVDLLISPLGPRQRNRPREDEFVFSAVEDSPRRLRLEPTNVEMEDAEELYISIHAFQPEDKAYATNGSQLHQFTLLVRPADTATSDPSAPDYSSDDPSAHADETQCANCRAWVPQRTLFLHENFCRRNNILCPQCHQVFQKSSAEWQAHWHCPHDAAHGRTAAARAHHDARHHVPRSCPVCPASPFPSTRALAAHRTSTCPAKPILCRFCHLLVPQQGPDDPPLTDPAVALSGLTPHELTDGARTADCTLCARPVRLRDWAVHRRHHDFERRARAAPTVCRNAPCGRTLRSPGGGGSGSGSSGGGLDALGLCGACAAPLYASGAGDDRDGRALRRRVERRGLSQWLTGCGRADCGNVAACRTARDARGLPKVTSKEAGERLRPMLDGLFDGTGVLRLCVDAASEQRRETAGVMSAEDGEGADGYEFGWYVRALEECAGDAARARGWLEDWAPRKGEVKS